MERSKNITSIFIFFRLWCSNHCWGSVWWLRIRLRVRRVTVTAQEEWHFQASVVDVNVTVSIAQKRMHASLTNSAPDTLHATKVWHRNRERACKRVKAWKMERCADGRRKRGLEITGLDSVSVPEACRAASRPLVIVRCPENLTSGGLGLTIFLPLVFPHLPTGADPVSSLR